MFPSSRHPLPTPQVTTTKKVIGHVSPVTCHQGQQPQPQTSPHYTQSASSPKREPQNKKIPTTLQKECFLVWSF